MCDRKIDALLRRSDEEGTDHNQMCDRKIDESLESECSNNPKGNDVVQESGLRVRIWSQARLKKKRLTVRRWKRQQSCIYLKRCCRAKAS